MLSVRYSLYTGEKTLLNSSKEPKPCKNELNQNPGFARTEPEPESKKCAKTTELYLVKN